MSKVLQGLMLLIALGGSGCLIDTSENCGNGLITGFETCDDGNVRGGDGCSAGCVEEYAFTCYGEPSVCYRTSGWDVGASCDYAGDQDCFEIQRLYYCGADHRVYIRDCGVECAGYAAACCGYDRTYRDDNCLCCTESTCSGAVCFH